MLPPSTSRCSLALAAALPFLLASPASAFAPTGIARLATPRSQRLVAGVSRPAGAMPLRRHKARRCGALPRPSGSTPAYRSFPCASSVLHPSPISLHPRDSTPDIVSSSGPRMVTPEAAEALQQVAPRHAACPAAYPARRALPCACRRQALRGFCLDAFQAVAAGQSLGDAGLHMAFADQGSNLAGKFFQASLAPYPPPSLPFPIRVPLPYPFSPPSTGTSRSCSSSKTRGATRSRTPPSLVSRRAPPSFRFDPGTSSV
jgi:hypothetical protein